jgi:phage antirepressor YoqD-like protein
MHRPNDTQGSLEFDRESEAKAAETTGGLTLLSAEATNDRYLSTKRIAEITGKEHRNVLRDVREICQKLSITPLVVTAPKLHVDSGAVMVEHYANGDVFQFYLDEHHCRLLATRYDIRLADLILSEWEQLKKKLHASPALPDLTDPVAAALALAEQAQKFAAEYQRAQKLAEEKRVLEEQNAVLAPKAHVADVLANSEGLYTFNEVGKALDLLRVGQNRLFEILRKRNVLYRRDGINYPYQKYIDAGYLRVKMKEIHKNGSPQMYPQSLFTGKGVAWVMRLVEEERQSERSRVTPWAN